MLSDTHPEAEKVQLEIIRRMSVSQKLSLVGDLNRIAVHLSRQSVAIANPGLDKEQLDLLWIERQYGRELAEGMREYMESRPK